MTTSEHIIVDVIAPSSAGYLDNLSLIEDYIIGLGFEPRIASDIYSHDIFYANTNKYRAHAFEKAITNHESQIIWCIRGGKGASEILSYLIRDKLQNVPQKILIGFSDITALQIYMQQNYDWQDLSAPMLEQIVKHEVSHDSIALTEKILKHEVHEGSYDMECLNKAAHKEISGKITGGNLTVVQCSLGTPWQIDTTDKILFLEDINEEGYKIEEVLTQFEQAGLFNCAKGVVFGDFVSAHNDKLDDVAIERFVAKHQNLPVFRIHNIGHNYKNNPLPFNTEASITIETKNSAKLKVAIPLYK